MGFKSTYFMATALVAALVFGNAAPHAKADVIITISGEISEVPDSFAGTDFVVGNPFSASFLLDLSWFSVNWNFGLSCCDKKQLDLTNQDALTYSGFSHWGQTRK